MFSEFYSTLTPLSLEVKNVAKGAEIKLKLPKSVRNKMIISLMVWYIFNFGLLLFFWRSVDIHFDWVLFLFVYLLFCILGFVFLKKKTQFTHLSFGYDRNKGALVIPMSYNRKYGDRLRNSGHGEAIKGVNSIVMEIELSKIKGLQMVRYKRPSSPSQMQSEKENENPDLFSIILDAENPLYRVALNSIAHVDQSLVETLGYEYDRIFSDFGLQLRFNRQIKDETPVNFSME